MSRWIRSSLVALLVLAALPTAPAVAQTNADCHLYGTHSDGASYCITLPSPGAWNGGLVIFAHGYVGVDEPLDIPWSQMALPDGAGGVVYMNELVNSLGFAFATTSYSVNGLAVKQGIVDVLDLVEVFRQRVYPPAGVLLVGASEGGLVTTLAVERYPGTFAGGLSTCGPIGDFRGQINYWGDFRVVFDYFMDRPGFNILPGSAVDIPQRLMAGWDSYYVPRIAASLTSYPSRTAQMLSVTGVPYEPSDPVATIGETTLGILWYNVFATNDGIEKLGGQPFDNLDRVYGGSANDLLLNRRVKRFSADPSALAEIEANYETSGVLARPLVTMHTTGDPIVPAWHQDMYAMKVAGVNPFSPYVPNTIHRYGHCAFTLAEIQAGFGQLVFMVTQASQTLP